ncbi:thioredoxin domain-containing protein [Candidatus Woesearchaeota archaeon]|nr:thioredoxin domain-containing protein [Candidatus Woesearchaeota archaeon]
MAAKKRKNKAIFPALLLVIFLIFSTANIYGFYKKGYANNKIIKEGLKPSPNNFYGLYVSAPSIYGRSYYGDGNASITVTGFLDPGSESSREFMLDVFPGFDKDYVSTGKAKFYAKYYITNDDIAAKNNKFIYAASLLCVSSLNSEAFYGLYFDALRLNVQNDGIRSLLDKHKISKKEFDECINNPDMKDIKMDAAEVENFGIVGISPRFYIGLNGRSNIVIDGVPSYAKFRQAVREHEYTIGN